MGVSVGICVCPPATHILLSLLYGAKAPGGIVLIEFCSKRLRNTKKNKQALCKWISLEAHLA